MKIKSRKNVRKVVKTFCPTCNAEKEIANAKAEIKGKAETITGYCETCGRPLKLIRMDMQKRV